MVTARWTLEQIQMGEVFDSHSEEMQGRGDSSDSDDM